jgi:uncharacterized flavoprotein (TIGR03862 family)
LRAAEVASAQGIVVTLYESKRSVGRKFLVAGKGGLNLTHAEPLPHFTRRYTGPNMPEHFWGKALGSFNNEEIREWAADLGTETFVASSGRVYPKALKAAPLLRAWLRRLREQGVELKVNHRLVAIHTGSPHELTFEHDGERKREQADAVIFALGGGSWPQTGSDGAWVKIFENLGVDCHPLQSANCGWEAAWPEDFLAHYEGVALKNLVLRAGELEARGELVITRYGLEGGPLYKLGPALRTMAHSCVTIDFKPDLTTARMVEKMESVRRNFLQEARVRWKIPDAALAIVEWQRDNFASAEELAKRCKSCELPLQGPRPLPEAISSAGGVTWSEVDDSLMLRQYPGLFVAGEMLDWEAPTGGYLLQGCFASGTLAARSACYLLGK